MNNAARRGVTCFVPSCLALNPSFWRGDTSVASVVRPSSILPGGVADGGVDADTLRERHFKRNAKGRSRSRDREVGRLFQYRIVVSASATTKITVMTTGYQRSGIPPAKDKSGRLRGTIHTH